MGDLGRVHGCPSCYSTSSTKFWDVLGCQLCLLCPIPVSHKLKPFPGECCLPYAHLQQREAEAGLSHNLLMDSKGPGSVALPHTLIP